jgi:uncharacterized tellurite resistance protein B-like protein
VIDAYCHLRRSFRSFRIDRIIELACIETGELLDPAEHFHGLRSAGAIKVRDRALTAIMRLLVFMARCDGHYHELEKSELEDVLGRYALRFGGDDATLEASIVECSRLAPSSTDVMRALKSFKTLPECPRISRFAIENCGRIIDADGRHSAEELDWALEVSAALKALAARPA